MTDEELKEKKEEVESKITLGDVFKFNPDTGTFQDQKTYEKWSQKESEIRAIKDQQRPPRDNER